MTVNDTIAVLSILKSAYQSFYAKMTKQEAESVINLWSELFADDDAGIVKLGLKELICSHTGFPPDIAELKNKINEIVGAVNGGNTDIDQWNRLVKAVESAAYPWEAKAAYEALPAAVKSWVGSPSALHDLGQEDSSVFSTVTRSNFLRTIPQVRKREEYRKSLPPEVKAYIAKLTAPKEAEQLADENAERNKVLDRLDGVVGALV